MSINTTDNALLARDSYKDHSLNEVIELGGVKYKIFDHTNNPHTGYQATAYQRVDSGEVVIAHRGTEFDREPVHDGGVDAGMVLTGLNAQSPDAIAFTQRVIDEAKKQSAQAGYPYAVTVTGHSLGGTLAEITAAKFDLKGETFNAYGAAGLLYGIPEGGHQVIDHIRAGDLVSAASPHFGEVHTYAAPQDIETLTKAGYRDDSGPLSPRNPIKATDFSAHGIDNFVPDNKLLGHSIIGPEGEALYREHQGMIDRYRSDVRDIRTVLSAGWEVPLAVVHGVEAAGHAAAEKITEGAHAIEHAVQSVAHEVSEKFEAAGEAIRSAEHAVAERTSRIFNTLTHPGSWFDSKREGETTHLDHPSHPDHTLFTQARQAVQTLDAAHQRSSDTQSDNFAASLVVAARRQGLERIDHVVLSEDASRAYAVQGDLQSPFKRYADIPTQEGVNTPVDKSSAAWEQLAQQAQLAERRAQSQTQTEQQTPQPGR
ncbi:XVIPCD domain-containing protein [Dyella koreensis]|uniref:X-Tfes XVIPCD domain-containing protein n=1 Tax=Dyella koreensis TaxID=311235 RepID=A0ABW8K1V1_9GAMM